MPSWRDEILSRFGPNGEWLTVVHDPDRLLTEEWVLNGILRNGYEVLIYDDPIAFRYVFEANYRSSWDAGEAKRLLVVVQTAEDVRLLPYDVLARARVMRFALHDFFPGLSAPVVEELDRSLLDELWNAYQRRHGTTLGDRSTREFILTHCYHVVPDLVRTPVELTTYLLRRHYKGENYPQVLDELLVAELARQPKLSGFPLEGIVPNRQEFFVFLQEQWRRFVTGETGDGSACAVPFEHNDVRIYVNDLFLEGILQPVEPPLRNRVLPEWTRFGIVSARQHDAEAQFDELLSRLNARLPDDSASYRDWQNYATLWAETTALRWRPEAQVPSDQIERWAALHPNIESRFAQWMLMRFAALANIPPHPSPVIAHQVPRYLSAMRNRREVGKVALLLVDGLAMDQWLVVRHALEQTRPEWRYDVSAVFTWVPSLTPVCRQAIFAGEPPLSFPQTIHSTNKDGDLWLRFWEEHSATSAQVRYWRGAAQKALPWLDDCLSDPIVDTIGLVVSDVDEMAHGTTLGTEGLHHSVGLWAQQDHLGALIAKLQGSDFAVFIIADHGNVQANGIGLPREGVLVQTAGSRARTYQSRELRSAAHGDLPQTLEWTGAGLPPGNEILLPNGLTAFATTGKVVVTHGGIALEEILVPFVRVLTGVADGA